MMRIIAILGAGLIGLMHPPASNADPLDFTFSFTGTVPPGEVAGTVTGEIIGLTNNATGSASNVIVDTFPAGLNLPTPPITIFTTIGSNTGLEPGQPCLPNGRGEGPLFTKADLQGEDARDSMIHHRRCSEPAETPERAGLPEIET